MWTRGRIPWPYIFYAHTQTYTHSRMVKLTETRRKIVNDNEDDGDGMRYRDISSESREKESTKIFSFYTETETGSGGRERGRDRSHLVLYSICFLLTLEHDNNSSGDGTEHSSFRILGLAVASVTKCIQQYPNLTTIKTRKAIHIFFFLLLLLPLLFAVFPFSCVFLFAVPCVREFEWRACAPIHMDTERIYF